MKINHLSAYVVLFCIIFYLLILDYNDFNYLNNHSNDLSNNKILHLREEYKKMASDNRINMDICDNSDRMGTKRAISKDIGNNCEPWISRECIFVLDHILPVEGIGLEWSSGSSTLWLSYRIKELISIENNEKWSRTVNEILIKRNMNNKTKVLWIDKDDIKNCDKNTQFISKFYNRETCFKSYVTTNLIPNITFDFINIDGRARTGCLLRAIKIIKKENGIIIIDNAERERYKWSFKYIPFGWSKYNFWYKSSLVKMYISH